MVVDKFGWLMLCFSRLRQSYIAHLELLAGASGELGLLNNNKLVPTPKTIQHRLGEAQ